MPAIEDVADEAAASTVVRSYLKLRGIATTGTLALMASDEAQLVRVLVEPLLSGWKDGATVVTVPESDKPIAHAMLLHMWNLSRAHWMRSSANPANTPAPASSASQATPAAADPKEEKIPKSLPTGVWGQLIAAYNGAQLHGRDRQFPVRELMGAETIVARMWWEHHKTKLYTPLHLGELLQHRSFQSNGDLNPLAKGQKKLTNLALEDGSLVQKEDAVWQPKSILAIMDGITAAKWAMILVQLGDELDVVDYCDTMSQRARSRPTKCEQFNLYWSNCGWRLAMSMRDGMSFAAAAKQIIGDYDKFAEHMSKEDSPKKLSGGAKGRQTEAPKGYGKFSKNRNYQRWSPYGKGRWSQSDWSPSGYASPWTPRSQQQPWTKNKEWEQPRNSGEAAKDK